MIQPLIPKVLIVVRNFISIDRTKAVNLMEIWEDLLETEVSILAHHLPHDEESDFPAGDIIEYAEDVSPIWTMSMTKIKM